MEQRKPTRLGYYDYSNPGAYFVTICTQNHRCILSDIVGDGSPVPYKNAPSSVGDGFPVPPFRTKLTYSGKIVQAYIGEIPQKYPTVRVDHYVIMPNHIHLLLSFYENPKGFGMGKPSPTVGNPGRFGTGNPSPTLGNVIGWLKYQITRDINLAAGTPSRKIFQRSYHDHIIRNEKDYQRIWTYIDGNPARWKEDCFYMDDPRDIEGAIPYDPMNITPEEHI